MRRLKAKARVSGGPTNLKITPVAEQDEETTKRREGEDGGNGGCSPDLWWLHSNSHYKACTILKTQSDFYARKYLCSILPLFDCPCNPSFVFVLLLVRLIFNTLFYTRDLYRQARLERVSSCAFQVKFQSFSLHCEIVRDFFNELAEFSILHLVAR